ncbi:hypothetical protein [Streptomyces ipomoeae]|uniref:hypothetical protein n=1 Tax=Streptomyces ipomoeae TaxID=103232 RepID=UPI0029BB9A75|nr:hypothetical protein [Streptomyces ipomoeae]MDX2695934.1 hypothetical protein [Streptomyces ipomoeae]MDX2843384.1 hypothetical protein [Streptomyces ipomoeae]
MSLFRETKREDDARTGALLDAVDAAFDDGGLATYDDPAFEDVVLEGLGCGPDCTGQPYPPAGHNYPRRG